MASTDITVSPALGHNHATCVPPHITRVSSHLGTAERTENHSTILSRVACLQARGLAALEFIAIDEGASVAQVMNTLRDKFGKNKMNCFLNIVFLFREQALLEGNVSVISPTDTEAQTGQVRVVGIKDLQPSSILTEAFHHPAAFASSQDFVSSNRHCVVRPGANPDDPVGALVVGWVTRKEYLAYFIGIIILLSMVVGVLVGFVTQSATLGLTVSSGLGIVLSCVELLVIWQFR